ncbi:glycine--tRNA ligase [Candidatus Parcubacteria bacterium]|nr:glycine--tRNA ligase [Candidatus Parcubacteria bacterium]
MSDISLEDIVSLCKRRGFIYQGSEIYGGLSGTWDYGPLGVALKRNITSLWWKTFVEDRADMYGVDAAIIMPEKVFEASGHLAGFKDPLVVCTNCHSQFRADHLEDNKCPTCGQIDAFGEPRMFNMMLKTKFGAVEDAKSPDSFLRPETAQGIFTNFNNVVDSFYPDIPFGIAQIGKAFRNEISPRDFVFRSREFEQMEIEYFIHPDEWEEAFENWRLSIKTFLRKVGLPEESVHELEVPEEDRAHYSKRTIDFEFDFPHKKDELLGLAYRTDYDLSNHQKVSGKNMQYRPKDGNEPFLPHVIEPSFGIERLIMAVLTSAYIEDEINGEKRTYLKLPHNLAPVKVAVSPLLKNKPELVAKAKEVYDMLKKEFGNVMWDDNGNIGKRYRRQDEIGTPYCVVIDFESLDANDVTIRDRDTTKQERVKVDDLLTKLSK